MADSLPAVPALLSTAVTALGGEPRPQQQQMAAAVADAIDSKTHLAVQAGTGTGKSLAYLVPGVRHAVESAQPVVVATATLALQRQLIERDLPRLSEALHDELGRAPGYAILKGRANYLCLNKIHAGMAPEPEDELFDPFAASRLGREVKRLIEWSSDTETGDRDDLTPGVSNQAWRQVSVTSRECLGKARCPMGEECFAELARSAAGRADVVVTNHAMLAVDSMTEAQILPEHDVLVIDEAHELVDRFTNAATAELGAGSVTAASRRAGKLVESELTDRLEEAAEGLDALLAQLTPGMWNALPGGAEPTLAAVRDAAWAVRTAIGPVRAADDPDGSAAAARSAAITALEEVHDAAVRVLTAFEKPDAADRTDVVWFASERRGSATREVLYIAPLSVAGLLRTRVFDESTVIMTSATLTVGGQFRYLARSCGLPAEDENVWRALDVGSPFDYRRQGILYVADDLPAPGREGTSPEVFARMEQLIRAAGGRTLGLFSSMRAAETAAAELRERLDTPVLLQGEDSMPNLVRAFTDDPATSLFGTLTLWQGVDVPGPSLSLVLIDRIPFPRPDDPLNMARTRAVASHGGNGFLQISASHAALLLAQGVGRLIRRADDRGVVAVLDARLVTKRYGGFLRGSLPPFHETLSLDMVTGALARLTGTPASAAATTSR